MSDKKQSPLSKAVEAARQNRSGAGDVHEGISWGNKFLAFRRQGMDPSDAAKRADEAIARALSPASGGV